jgi:pilus assembly protein CpaF
MSKNFQCLVKLQSFMDDPEIEEEIWINSPNRIFIAKNGISTLTNLVLSESDIHQLLERSLIRWAQDYDVSNPFVDARLPDGSRLHAAIPEVTATHWSVNIRKHLMRGSTLEDLVNLDAMSIEIAKFLNFVVDFGANILVSGGTQDLERPHCSMLQQVKFQQPNASSR